MGEHFSHDCCDLLCSRNTAEVAPSRCAHGCRLFGTQTKAHGCTGCESMGGAFVLSEESHRIRYPHRAYRDVVGVEQHQEPAFDLAAHGYQRATYRKRRIITRIALTDSVRPLLVPRQPGKTKLGCSSVANTLWNTRITAPVGPSRCSTRLLEDSMGEYLLSTPAEIEAWLTNLAARVLGNPTKNRVVFEKKEKVFATAWQPKQRAWPFTPWEAPTFDVIPLGVYLKPIERTTVGYRGENGNSHANFSKPWEPLTLKAQYTRRLGHDFGGVRMDHTARLGGSRYEDYGVYA